MNSMPLVSQITEASQFMKASTARTDSHPISGACTPCGPGLACARPSPCVLCGRASYAGIYALQQSGTNSDYDDMVGWAASGASAMHTLAVEMSTYDLAMRELSLDASLYVGSQLGQGRDDQRDAH